MSAAILNQPWEDVADDVTGAIEKAVQPLLKKAVDDIYGGLLDATQDYLKDNLAFNIASRIATAEREAYDARTRCAALQTEKAALLEALENYRCQFGQALKAHGIPHSDLQMQIDEQARAAISLAKGESA